MIQRSLVSLILTGASLLPVYAANADLYREAQIQENTSQNPEAAARLYSQFLEQSPKDRSLQADALLHLGLCQARLGRKDDARASYKRVVQGYADQSAPFARASSELQTLAVADAELAAARVPLASTPVIKVVYEPVRTLWNFEFLRLFDPYTIDSKGRFIGGSTGLVPSFEYFLKPGTFAVGFGGGIIASGSDWGQSSTDVLFLQPHVRIEKHLWGPLIPYATFGPSIYRFRFSGQPIDSLKERSGPEQHESHWTAGLNGEVGFARGWTRGFTLNMGYSLQGLLQVTPSSGYQQLLRPGTDAPEAYQNHGLRWIGGPVFSLAFRW